MKLPVRRDDLLVSVCVPELPDPAGAVATIERTAQLLQQNFRYWELLLLTSRRPSSELAALLRRWSNIRLMQVRHGTEHYQRRLVAASEAIGDVVVLTAVEELECFDIPAMVARAHDEGRVILGQQSATRLWEPVARAVGRTVGFRLSGRDAQTATYPRPTLGRLLSHPDRLLAARFLPLDSGIEFALQPPRHPIRTARSWHIRRRRLALLQRLAAHSAPVVLRLVSLLSLMLTVLSVAYGCYAVAAWLVLDDVQPGWLTTSLLASASSAFLSLTLFGIASGVQRVLDLLTPATVDDVVAELGGTDLFGQVRDDLNLAYNVEQYPSAARAEDSSLNP